MAGTQGKATALVQTNRRPDRAVYGDAYLGEMEIIRNVSPQQAHMLALNRTPEGEGRLSAIRGMSLAHGNRSDMRPARGEWRVR